MMRQGDILRAGMSHNDIIKADYFGKTGVYGDTILGKRVYVPYIKIFEASEVDKIRFKNSEEHKNKMKELKIKQEVLKNKEIKHIKTGKRYTISDVAILEATFDIVVMYTDDNMSWVRPINEIFDKFKVILA